MAKNHISDQRNTNGNHNEVSLQTQNCAVFLSREVGNFDP